MSLKSMLFAATSAIFALLANGEVHKLTADTFDAFLKENPMSLVKFYAPWCGHCKSLAPHFEAAAEKIPDSVKLAEVDVTEQEALGTRFEIRGFPTMKFFRDGTPEEYTGGRTTETIVEWINLMTSDPVTSVASIEAAREQFPAETIIMATFKKDSEEQKLFQKLAESNRLLGRFVFSEGEPTIKVYRVGDTEAAETPFTAEESDIVQFIKNERLPYFGPVSGETFASYMETGLDFIWFAGTKEDMTNVESEMNMIGKEYRGKYNFVWLDTEVFARQADGMLGVTEFPSIVRTVDGPGRFIFTGEKTSAALKKWITDMEEGKVVAQLKSEPVPESNDEPVKVVVGSEFDKIVTDDKDVLLEIYAPWCGHCKKLAPAYETVAEKMATLSPNVVIAKIDGTANEIATEGYEFQGFPTLYFKKAGQKAVVYQGGREVSDIMKFLAENVSTPFEYVEEAAEKESHDEL